MTQLKFVTLLIEGRSIRRDYAYLVHESVAFNAMVALNIIMPNGEVSLLERDYVGWTF